MGLKGWAKKAGGKKVSLPQILFQMRAFGLIDSSIFRFPPHGCHGAMGKLGLEAPMGISTFLGRSFVKKALFFYRRAIL